LLFEFLKASETTAKSTLRTIILKWTNANSLAIKKYSLLLISKDIWAIFANGPKILVNSAYRCWENLKPSSMSNLSFSATSMAKSNKSPIHFVQKSISNIIMILRKLISKVNFTLTLKWTLNDIYYASIFNYFLIIFYLTVQLNKKNNKLIKRLTLGFLIKFFILMIRSLTIHRILFFKVKLLWIFIFLLSYQ